MKLKYKVINKGKDHFNVSLDCNQSIDITPEMFQDVRSLNWPNHNDKLLVDAAKAEIHWRLTNKNMDLHNFTRRMRHILGDALFFEDEKLKQEKIKDALRYMNNFFEDENGLY